MSNYCIRDGYRSRDHEVHWDDTKVAGDLWQREVYLMAAAIMAMLAPEGHSRVHDIGCGSGWKLVNMLGGYETIGWDVPQTVRWLRQKYPDREWREPGDTRYLRPADLVICADVIEHVVDPDALLAFIKSLGARHAIISTPDRDLYEPGHRNPPNGPPAHLPHVREWNFAEFGAYMASHFKVLDHRVTGKTTGLAKPSDVQPTQCVIVEMKA